MQQQILHQDGNLRGDVSRDTGRALKGTLISLHNLASKFGESFILLSENKNQTRPLLVGTHPYHSWALEVLSFPE